MSWIIDKLGDTLQSFFFGILLTLDSFIYSLVSGSYKIFMALASARLLSSDNFTEIANKLYLIIGVSMLFVLSYAILQGIIDPDKKSDANGGKLVKSIIIAVFGLALAPVLFNILYQAQGLILENNVLNKIFFRTDKGEIDIGDVSYDYKEKDKDTNELIDKSSTISLGKIDYNDQIKDIGGAYTATSIWSAFFLPSNIELKSNEEIIEKCDEEYINNGKKYTDDDSEDCMKINPRAGWSEDYFVTYDSKFWEFMCAGLPGKIFNFTSTVTNNGVMKSAVAWFCNTKKSGIDNDKYYPDGHRISLQEAYTYTGQGGSFDVYQAFLPNYFEKDTAKDYGEIKYIWGLSTIIGIFALYCFVSFSIDMGVRAAKLAYYQIIAPVPIIMQIVPKFKNIFQDYIKNVLNTFLEVFIRILVVYIATYVVCHVPELFSSTGAVWQNNNLNILEKLFAQVFLIIGILIFAKQAPKLIGETLGIKSGNLKLGIGQKLAEGGIFAAGGVLGAMATAGVRNLRNGISQPGKFHERIGRGIRSSIAGAGSAGARSIRSQFIGPNHKQAMTWSDMKAQAGQSAQAATDARDRRAQAYKEQASKGRTGVSAFAAHHVENAVDRFNAWSTGTVDTSYMDGQVSIYSELRGLESKLEDTVKNDALVKDAQRKADMLNNVDIGDLAYNQAVTARATANVVAAKANALKGMSEAEKSLRWINEGLDPTLYTSAAFDAAVDSGQIKDAVTQAEIDAEKTSVQSTFKRSDYAVDINSQEYRDAQNLLAQQMKDAATELSKAKKEAVQRRFAEAATGIENETSRVAKEFFNEKQKELRAHANDELLKDASGRSISIGEFVSKNFGAGAIVNGTVDLGQTLGSQNNVISYKLEGTSGSTVGNVTVTNTGTGQAKFEVQELDASGTVTSTQTFTNQADYEKYIASHNISKTKDSTLTGDRQAVTADLKNKAESARDALMNSEKYRNDKARQRAAQENK